MKIVFWFGALILMFAAVAAYQLKNFSFSSSGSDANPTYIVSLADATVHVTLARTEAEQERGLGGRDGLESDQGMLFVFDHDARYGFWMKNMSFSIDIIWLAVDGSVVDIAENVAPNTYPRSFTPRSPARFVLEVPAGFARQHMVQIGDHAKLP